MNPILMSAVVIVCAVGGAHLGMAVRKRLPEHHLNADTKEVVKLGAGLIAPKNWTVRVVLFISAVSIAGAIFLILEMNTPLGGIIKVSSAPMQKALTMLGR